MDTSHVIWTIVMFLSLVVYLLPMSGILRKAGYSGWWCLLMFLPIVNFIMLCVFATAKWPNLRDAKT